MSLLVVGTVAFDQIETPFGKTDKILGGAATFIGIAASKLEVNAGLVSVIGGDFPQEYIDLMKSHKLDLSGVKKIDEGKTFFWSGRYKNDMNTRETLVTELNVDRKSTRLNSSHVAISYAVFCLKKKSNKQK